ncbi:hypothetical protein ABVB25_04905 [Streptomyces anthocyanicus]|uniref:hypothetical protein n=1 Tax=Streptomyces anthocyanicus TaxID=68174 RepID=UPI00336A0E6B
MLIHGAYELLTGSGIASPGRAFRADPRPAAAALRNWSTEQTRTGRTGYASPVRILTTHAHAHARDLI